MPYDPIPTASLDGHLDHVADFQAAHPGQWWIGVLDTHYKRVYILPITPLEGANAATNTGDRNRNRYASGPARSLAPVAWRSCDNNWMQTTPGYTTHQRCCVFYGLEEIACLGFTLIKLSHHHAMIKLASNSLNAIHGGIPHHSFARSTALNHAVTGTPSMPQPWADALKQFFVGPPYHISNIAMSFD